MPAAKSDTQLISLRLEPEIIKHLRSIARYEAFERDTDVSYSELVREAILQTYPMPGTAELTPVMPKEQDADADKNDLA